MAQKVVLYSRNDCRQCKETKKRFKEFGIDFEIQNNGFLKIFGQILIYNLFLLHFLYIGNSHIYLYKYK